MKKIVLALVVLLFATPAWAAVNITVTQVPDSNEVIIGYDASGEANLVRAFGLNVQLSNDANIVEVVPAMVGVCTELEQGYGIFPGTIQIDAAGEVTYDGTPVGEYGDLETDTLPGLDSNGVTLELASLYSPVGPGSPNAPAVSGDLVSIFVNKPGCLTISANVSRAGATGVVMEDPDEVVVVNYPAEHCIPEWEILCYQGMEDYDQWEALGKPDCWCYPRQCRGDADGLTYGKNLYWVSLPDLAILKDAWGKQTAQLVGNEACADFDHLPYGKNLYRVSLPDLDILKNNWSSATTPDDCLPGNETPN